MFGFCNVLKPLQNELNKDSIFKLILFIFLKEFVGQLQRANKYEGTPRESIHESLERLPMFDNESKKSTSSQQYRNEKSDGLSRNSFSPSDFMSTSPRHSTAIGSICGKKNKMYVVLSK